MAAPHEKFGEKSNVQQTDGLGHDFKDLGTLTKNLCSDAAHKVQDNVTDAYQQSKAQANKLGKQIGTTIQQKPMVSLLIAAGVGLVLGKMWSRG